jgi:hypothetical protein
VAHFGLFDVQIVSVVLAGLDADGNFFDDGQAIPFD